MLRKGELGSFEIRNLAGLIGLTGNEDVCPFISQPALVGRRRQPSAVDVAGREKPLVYDCEAQPANGFHQGAGPGFGLGIAGTEIGVASAGTEKPPPGLMGVCPFALCKTQQTLVFRSPIFDGISVWAIETTQTLGR